jgi:hypothetical protein
MSVTYNNYWKLNLTELPTMGKLYPQGTIIKIRPLNVQEIKYLATISEENATDIINEILEKCLILKGIEFEDIYLGDRVYLAFWVRVNSFTKNNGYDINIKECDKCKNPYTTNIKLTDFEEKYITEDEHEIDLPDCGITLKLKYPTIRDLDIKCEDKEIEKFIRHLDMPDKNITILEQFMHGLSALDYSILKNSIDKMDIGFSNQITIYCPMCNQPHTYTIEYSDAGLLGTVNLFEILEMTLRISKSMNFQIRDDMPWMEVEILQEAANKIDEEERKQLEKDSGKISMNRVPDIGNIQKF